MKNFVLRGISRVYEGRKVLDIPELSLDEGRVCALLGPNGAGKTTLLNILAFLDRPTTGTVHYRSREVRWAESELQPLRREVVMVDQRPIMFSTTVFRNLEFGLKVRGVSRKEREGRIAEALEMVGMRRFEGTPAHRLSGGETQRVALARALVLSPTVFLCDEPTASVDVENRAIILAMLRRINEEKAISIVFTTHDRMQAVRLAHRTIVLDHGKIVKAQYENIFPATLKRPDGGAVRCDLSADISLVLDASGTVPPPGPVRIFIDPAMIGLNGTGGREGVRSVVEGRVRQVMEENSHIRMSVDAGLWLNVTTSKEHYRKSGLHVGDRVRLSIPAEAVQILTEAAGRP